MRQTLHLLLIIELRKWQKQASKSLYHIIERRSNTLYNYALCVHTSEGNPSTKVRYMLPCHYEQLVASRPGRPGFEAIGS